MDNADGYGSGKIASGGHPKELGDLSWIVSDIDKKVLKNTRIALGDTLAGKQWAEPEEIYEIFRGDEQRVSYSV